MDGTGIVLASLLASGPQYAGFIRRRRAETIGTRIGETPARAPAVIGRTTSALVGDPGVGGSTADRSRISPVPAYSRTCRIPDTADGLSSKAFETAMTVPSGAFSRNLYRECASRKSSNSPAIAGLPQVKGDGISPEARVPGPYGRRRDGRRPIDSNDKFREQMSQICHSVELSVILRSPANMSIPFLPCRHRGTVRFTACRLRDPGCWIPEEAGRFRAQPERGTKE